jgi:TatD DNase family protein
VPYRGKTTNPSYVPFVAKILAELKGTTQEQMGELTSRNFDLLFSKIHTDV